MYVLLNGNNRICNLPYIHLHFNNFLLKPNICKVTITTRRGSGGLDGPQRRYSRRQGRNIGCLSAATVLADRGNKPVPFEKMQIFQENRTQIYLKKIGIMHLAD